jgi:hypothetical protein
MDDEREREMSEAVRSYLAEHPRQQIRIDVERLDRVLWRLVAAGVLEAVGPTASPSFRLRRDPR